MWLFGDRAFKKIIKVEGDHNGGVIVQFEGCLSKKRKRHQEEAWLCQPLSSFIAIISSSDQSKMLAEQMFSFEYLLVNLHFPFPLS